MKIFVGEIVGRLLELMPYTTRREQALVLELAQIKDQLVAATARGDTATATAEERLALLTASAALAEERAALLTAAASRAENAEKQLGLERSERELAAKHVVRLELRVQALKRRRAQLQEELRKLQDQLARADVSGRIRELQEERAQLQQRLADLQTYFNLRTEPLQAPANPAEERRGSPNPR